MEETTPTRNPIRQMEPLSCKKHGGKPRTIVYHKTMPNGAVFPFVGCVDCAAGKPRTTQPKKKPANIVKPIK